MHFRRGLLRKQVHALNGLSLEIADGDFFALVPDAMAVWRRGFTAVLRAVGRGDGDAVAGEFLRAMRRIGEKVVAVFEARGLFEPAPTA